MPARATSARRFAESVFDLAKEQNAFDRWLDDLETIRSTFTNPDMARFLADPKSTLADKEAVVVKLLEGKVDRLALNLARLLVQRELTETIAGIERDFRQMVNDERNIAVAEVTTAVELGKQQLDLVKQRLEVLTTKNIELQTKLDPSILGGFVARVGDTLIDASLATRLATLRQDLLAHT